MPRSKLPPLPALRAFEAVARRSSFKQAAAELSVTPTAISHQIRQLETYLGRQRVRSHAALGDLTADGAALYEVTRAGFEAIAEVVARVRAEEGSTRITLSSTSAFLGHWLPSRLEALRREIPTHRSAFAYIRCGCRPPARRHRCGHPLRQGTVRERHSSL